ncbi:RNA helicase [Vibrio artabrorum]|uniref:RNA helicase n=1 Tax=Vibrio artabrorum TaxID=446374 RepID=A0ABT8CN50_9VIBR|nr:RNA helicase [Vibrio artabrorum]MDN3702415.1 RNA helicase [Vibrio artabrorum]
MSTTTHETQELEYELCYFDNGRLTTITISAHNRQEAIAWYLSEERHINDIYSIRPDE